ncbi:MAG: prolipoprotein diacylglyceryl transferase [Lachnospiraceae bacterium]|nr:prolipoprotein diacylglyceryl transferase [Lachnospiraceae bacterium]MCD7765608.1 prolipoprotein diacylglyceryl transferase [Lachnospiraceae bacterium]
MEGTIRFPHLGITLTNVIKNFQIGGISIAMYGVVLAVAMMTGLLLVMKVAKATGQKEDDYFDFGIIAIIVAVICARIYYVVFSWDYYSSHLAEIFNLRKGGLAIYGGVIGGVLTALVFCHIRKIDWRSALDTACIGLVWGQAVGRWGNFFNREAFGDYADNLLAMQLPVSDVRASEITDTMRAHIQTIDGIEYIQVHPTFLYESLWNLGVLAILLLVTFRFTADDRDFIADAPKTAKPHRHRKKLTVFLLYLLLYGAGRFWIESLRTDQLILFGTGLPVSQVLSGIFVIASLILLIKRPRFMQ